MDQVNAATKSTKEEAEPQRIKVCATQGRSCCSCAFLGCWRFVIIDQFWISDRLFLLLLHPGSLCVCVVYPRCVRVSPVRARNTPITSGGGRNKNVKRKKTECGAGSGTHQFLEWNWKVLRDLGAAMQWICGCAEGMIRKIWLPE